MTTKLELIQAAQSAAAMSVELTGLPLATEAKVKDAKKKAFDGLGISKKNWQFFSDHFDGARQQYVLAAEAPIETDETKP
jgi:hypothetical protein